MDSIRDREVAITKIAESQHALEQLNQHLKEIAEGSAFSASDRCKQFLLYIVSQATTGNFKSLKERVIGVEVFGRSPDYNTSEDAIVRVTASDVRKRLQQHYRKNGASNFHISVPVGSYVPEITATSDLMGTPFDSQKARKPDFAPFRGPAGVPSHPAPSSGNANTSAVETPQTPNLETAFSQSRLHPRTRSFLQVVALLIALLVPLNLLVWSIARKEAFRTRTAALTTLPWSALFSSPHSTYIITSDPEIVSIQEMTRSRITLSDYVNQDYIPERSALSAQSREILLNTLHQDWSPPGDTRIAVSLAELAQSTSRTIRVQPAAKTRTSDLKTDENFILLGSPRSNPWVSLFNDRLDFQFFTPPGTENEQIRNIHPRPNEQSIYIPTTGTVGESYAIVAFVQNADQAGQVLIVAGATGQGTDAAGSFITDLPRLSRALQNCGISPSGPLKHFELLLRVSVMAGSSRGFDVAACHVLPAN